MYKVLCETNNAADDFINEFETELEAENFIKDQLRLAIKHYTNLSIEYNYGDFYNGDGHSITEIWEVGNDAWECWTRLWT